MNNYLRENLIYLRKSKKYNQNTFANLLNIKRSTYANWESGHSEPPMNAILHICNFLNIPLDDLVTNDLSRGKISIEIPNNETGKVSDKVLGKISKEDMPTPKFSNYDKIKNEIFAKDEGDIRLFIHIIIMGLRNKGLKINMRLVDKVNTYLLVTKTLELVELFEKIDAIISEFEYFSTKLTPKMES
ncbi:MAG: helix-turn-helix transcriptional regulator [Panacibacter sp.]